MEKKRWVLIFIGLCLALIFSVSSVEAQQHHLCFEGSFCDQDSDGFFRDHQRCVHCLEIGELDCNDHDGDVPEINECVGEDPPAFEPVQICHFKNILKHCEFPPDSGLFIGGGERTITSQRQLDQHLAHGDCEEGSFIRNPTESDGVACGNHCVALDLGERCGPAN